ncbi:hypothetical protein HI914_04382 [Erysiphe necator]|nr:hypothetical protein HI914_04382 [Erysiphe necator]
MTKQGLTFEVPGLEKQINTRIRRGSVAGAADKQKKKASNSNGYIETVQPRVEAAARRQKKEIHMTDDVRLKCKVRLVSRQQLMHIERVQMSKFVQNVVRSLMLEKEKKSWGRKSRSLLRKERKKRPGVSAGFEIPMQLLLGFYLYFQIIIW